LVLRKIRVVVVVRSHILRESGTRNREETDYWNCQKAHELHSLSSLSKEKRNIVRKAEAGSPIRGLRKSKMQGHFRMLAASRVVLVVE
jgi:hypothetical protein